LFPYVCSNTPVVESCGHSSPILWPLFIGRNKIMEYEEIINITLGIVDKAMKLAFSSGEEMAKYVNEALLQVDIKYAFVNKGVAYKLEPISSPASIIIDFDRIVKPSL
jgi:hypothetical protein